MKRPDLNSSPLLMRRNIQVSGKAAARAQTRHYAIFHSTAEGGSTRTLLASGFQSSQNGDSRLAQNALDHVVSQARCVVVKMEEIFFLVIAEFLKTVGVGELAQRAKVLRLESFLQFVGSSH